MKKHFYFPLFLIIFLSFWAVAAAPSVQAAACYQHPAGLISWWPGDGHPNDVTRGHDAVLHGDATTGTGLVGQAFVLDGDEDFVEVPSDPALELGTADFTVALWVLFNDTAGEQVLVEKWIQRSSTPPAPSEGWTLTKLEDNVLRLAMSSGTDADTNVDSAPLTIPTDTWIHFAATRQAGEVMLFMNGQPVASGYYADTVASTASLKFGHRGSPDDTPGSEDEHGYFLNGRIDEVQLLIGRALTQKSIQAIYDAGSLGPCFNLDASIIASLGDWFWTSGFNPGTLDLFIYNSAADDALLLWQGSAEADEAGFVHILYETHGQDLVPGYYLVVSDGTTEKGLVLETITIEAFDIGNEIITGTAPRGREVQVVAGMAEPETQGVISVIADSESGAWSADFKTIGFDITEEMGASFAQIHDDDGDANEAGVPAPSAAASVSSPAPFPAPAPPPNAPTAELLYPRLTGAFIELQAQPLRPGLWTRIQWQDALGGWHDIDGWQGSFNPDQRVLWYVGEEHLGDGPFRWLVYESQGGDLLAVSQSFDLPSRGGEVLRVEVSLSD